MRQANGIPTPPITPKRSVFAPVQKNGRMEYRRVQQKASSSVVLTPPAMPKAPKPVWKDILTKPRSLTIHTPREMLVVKETPLCLMFLPLWPTYHVTWSLFYLKILWPRKDSHPL